VSEPASRYAKFRRRLAPVAVLIALGVLAHETCNKKEAARQTIELRFGDHAAEIRHLRADLMVDGVPVAHLERDGAPDAQAPMRFDAMIDGDDVRVMVDITTGAGPRRAERIITRQPGAIVVVELGPELDRPARP
jgi:hypothetical protein